MPEATFTITGNIENFTRLDNLYTSLKREADKLLKPWTMDVKVSYTENQSDTEQI